MPAQIRPLERPLIQERKGKEKGEPALKKARRSSVCAPLVSESDTEELDTEESETEGGVIASRVGHSRPYYQHVSHRRERAQREREKEKAQRCIPKRRCQNLFADFMDRYKRTTRDADDQAWMTRIWDLVHQRTKTLGRRWVEQLSLVRAPSAAQRNRKLQIANNAVQTYAEQRKSLHTLQGAMKRAA